MPVSILKKKKKMKFQHSVVSYLIYKAILTKFLHIYNQHFPIKYVQLL